MPDKCRVLLNKADSVIPYPDELGGGTMVETEVFHQLHCLVQTTSNLIHDIVIDFLNRNFLRKVIYADYYSRSENLPLEFHASDELFFNHIGELTIC